jgi:osmoprotectant transport system permease protein
VDAPEGGVNALQRAIRQAFEWLNDPLNWTNPGGILDRLAEHLWISAAAVILGCLVAWPIGLWLGHAGRGGGLVVLVSNLTLAIPTLALLTILPLASFGGATLGFGKLPVIIALAVFAVPPLLANAYTGVRGIDPEVRSAAVGMGLSGGQLLRRVELPLAVPYLAAGFRTAAVQVVATAALASFVNGGGLGQIIAAGFGLGIAVAGGQIVAGGLLVALLALAVEGVLAVVERAVTPRPLRRVRGRGGRSVAAAKSGER